MTIRVWFGQEYMDFDDETPDDYINEIGKEWEQYGNLDTVRHKYALQNLAKNPDFLALPRMERHNAFNRVATSGPFWSLLEPEQRRAIRGAIVDVEGANKQETLSYFDAPFVKGKADKWDKLEVAAAMGFFPGGKSRLAQDAASTIAEFGRGLDRLAPKVRGAVAHGVADIADVFAGYLETNPTIPLSMPGPHFYTNPLFMTEKGKELKEATGELNEKARQYQIDSALGAEMTTRGRKYATLKEGLEAGPAGVAQWGAAVLGEQTPVIGGAVLAGSVPYAGAVLGPAYSAALQTGFILEDMERQGITGDDANTIAALGGIATGAMEYLPIGRALNRNPIVAKSWATWLGRKALQAVEQGGEEAITEFLQTGVENAMGDFVRKHRGELDKIVAWETPEGRKETVGDAMNAAVEGGFVGLVMGPFGGGTGQVRRQPASTGEAVSAAVLRAREILQRGLPPGPEGPAAPPGAPPGAPPSEPSAPAGATTTPSGGGPALTLLLGPAGASNIPYGGWSQELEQKARKMYAPDFLKNRTDLLEAFIRGDIDMDTMEEIKQHGEDQGMSRAEAEEEIRARTDRAIAFLTGGLMQPEQPESAQIPRPEIPGPPSQRGQTMRMYEGLGVGPAAPPFTKPGEFPVAPTQPSRVGRTMRLGEGIPARMAPEAPALPAAGPAAPSRPVRGKSPFTRTQPRFLAPEVQIGKPVNKITAADIVAIEEQPRLARNAFRGFLYDAEQNFIGNIYKTEQGFEVFKVKEGGRGERVGKLPVIFTPKDFKFIGTEAGPGAAKYRRFQLQERPPETGAGAPPEPPPEPGTAPTGERIGAQFVGDRRTMRRSREMDSAVNEIYNVMRQQGLDKPTVDRLVSRVEAGEDVMRVFGSDESIRNKLPSTELFQAALSLEEAVSRRLVTDRVQRELEAEAMGEGKPTVPIGPAHRGPETTEEKLRQEAHLRAVEANRKFTRKLQKERPDLKGEELEKVLGDNMRAELAKAREQLGLPPLKGTEVTAEQGGLAEIQPKKPVAETGPEPVPKGPEFTFEQKAMPQLRNRLAELHRSLYDTDTFVKSGLYDSSYPVPRTGGLVQATKTDRYRTDPDYRAKIDRALTDVTELIQKANRQLAILQGNLNNDGVFGVDYMVVPADEEKVHAGQTVNSERAWWMEAKHKYPYTSYLGNVAVREAVQNSVDAILDAKDAGEIDTGKMAVTTFNKDGEYSFMGVGYQVEDNGIGMTDTDIRDYFLRLHSTKKDRANRTGGFGIAVAVVLGPTEHSNWEVHTRDNFHNRDAAVEAARVTAVEPRQGTRVRVWDEENKRMIDKDAKKYVESSVYPAWFDVTFNGEPIKNPFARKKFEEHSIQIDDKSSMVVRYYPRAPEGYENNHIIRLHNEATGISLTQAVRHIGLEGFNGVLVTDVTTTEAPSSDFYPLTSSRMDLRWQVDEKVDKVAETYAAESMTSQRAGVTSKTYDLAERPEWQKTFIELEKPEGQRSTEAQEYHDLLAVIDEIFSKGIVPAEGGPEESFRGGAMTPLGKMQVDIDVGHPRYKGGTITNAKHIMAMQAAARLNAHILGGQISDFKLVLSKPVEGGRVAAQFHPLTWEYWFNPLAVDKAALKSNWHFAMYLKGLADHEITHAVESGHGQKYQSQREAMHNRTTDILPYLVRIARNTLRANDEWFMSEADLPSRIVEIQKEVEKKIKEWISLEQSEFSYDMMERGDSFDGLYYPEDEETRRQRGLFEGSRGRRTIGLPGEKQPPATRGGTEQPGPQGPTPGGAGGVPTGPVGIDEARAEKFQKRVATKGRKHQVITPEGSMTEEVQYEIVDIEHVVASHNANLQVNPEYPAALQPRARDRKGYAAQIEAIKNNLKPDLLGESIMSSQGAPIVGRDGIVESGNGRVIALQRMYNEKHDNAAVYKKWLVENAEKFGLDKRRLMGMRAPILVQERISGGDRVEFARKSNARETQEMSPIEVARADAAQITDEMMKAFNPGESLDINAASNNEFVTLFMKTIPDTEASGLLLADGSALNEKGVTRIKNAVLVKAWGDQPVLEKIIEDTSNRVKRIGSALMKAAPKVIDVKSGIAEGAHPAELDSSAEIMEAAAKISELRQKNITPDEFRAQGSLFGIEMTPVGRMIFDKFTEPSVSRSAVQMADMIERYYNLVSREKYSEQQPALDLGVSAATKEYLWQQVFDGKGSDQETLFSLSRGGRARGPIRVAHLHEAFKGWSLNQVRPGLFRVMRNGQPVVHIMFTRRTPTKAEIEAAAKGYDISFDEARAGIMAGEIVVKGSYTHDDISGAHIIALYSPNATPTTVFHEAFHFVFHNILTPAQRKTVLAAYKNEEAAARAYEKFIVKKLEPTSGIRRIFQQLRDFARSLMRANNVEAEAAAKLFEKIASGEIFKQEGRFFTRTDPSGIIPLKAIANTIWNAEDMAKEAKTARRLRFDQFPEAVEKARELAGTQFVNRGDGTTLFSLEIPDDIPEGHHPAAVFPQTSTSEIFKEWAEEKIFNRIAPIRVVQEKLTGIGQDLDKMFNAYLKAQNFQARAGAHLDWVEDNLFKPFQDALAASGISLQDFDLARMAAHALERNPKIRAAWVTIPIQMAEAKIKALSKRKLSAGTKVRALDRGNTGKVVSVNAKSGTAIVAFANEKGFIKKVRMPMRQLERESVAQAKDQIAEIRRMQQAGEVPHSGIADENAKAVLEEFKRIGLINWAGDLGPKTRFTGPLGDLFKPFQRIVQWKEQTLYDAGLLSKKELETWRDYKHYAPMRGKDPDILDIIAGGRRLPIPEIEMYGGKMRHRMLARLARGLGIERAIHTPTTGRGYNPGRRPAAHRALGRKSFPKHSPTVELFTDAMEVAVRSEKNRVAKTVWNLVNKFRDAVDQNGEKLWEIDRPDSRLVWDEKTGTVKTKIDGLSVLKDNVYNVWIDGELHYIRHVSPEMAEFISGLNNLHNPAEMAKFFRGASAVNRYISKMATGLNPAFTIPNAFRDAITAGIKIFGEKQFEGFGLKTMTRAPEAWATLAEYARRRSKGTLDQMDQAKRKRVEAFKLAGGETAFWMIPDLSRQMRNLQSALQEAQRKDPRALRYGKNIIHFIEDYNQAVEATMRFSVFERALEMGMSKDDAAKLARNITVDFTQQGTVANHLGSFYVFANASLQGSAMVAKAVAHNKTVQRMMAASIAMAFAHATAMRFLGGTDDDDEVAYWDKVTTYEKSRNMIFMLPGGGGERMKIPLPWGFNVFWNLGTVLSDVVWGPKTAAQGFFNVLGTVMSAFNPIGDNDLSTLAGWAQMATPAWADPVLDIALNKTFWGGPIRPDTGKFARSEQYGIAAPNYNRYFTGVTTPSKSLAKALYKYAGVDISPEDIDYGVGAVFGGLGDTVFRTVNLLTSPIAKRRALVARDWPIIRSFYADESNFFAPEMYRANMGDYWLKKETYDYLEKTDPQSAYEFKKRHWEVLRMEDFVKETEKRVRELKKAGIEISDSRMQREFKMFNRFYNTAERKTMKRRIKER